MKEKKEKKVNEKEEIEEEVEVNPSLFGEGKLADLKKISLETPTGSRHAATILEAELLKAAFRFDRSTTLTSSTAKYSFIHRTTHFELLFDSELGDEPYILKFDLRGQEAKDLQFFLKENLPYTKIELGIRLGIKKSQLELTKENLETPS